MTKSISLGLVTNELYEMMDETFYTVHGHYLDRGTSLFESLANVSAAEASTAISARGNTVAAHVEHTRFYLDVLGQFITGARTEKVNWEESWRIQEVSEPEWSALQERLAEQYAATMAVLREFDAEQWTEDGFSGALSILVHSAHHLGEIRQMLGAIQPAGE